MYIMWAEGLVMFSLLIAATILRFGADERQDAQLYAQFFLLSNHHLVANAAWFGNKL